VNAGYKPARARSPSVGAVFNQAIACGFQGNFRPASSLQACRFGTIA
jgi:hypothetical protein